MLDQHWLDLQNDYSTLVPEVDSTVHQHVNVSRETTFLCSRHPSNLMLDRLSGKILHIDFGDCFEVRADIFSVSSSHRRIKPIREWASLWPFTGCHDQREISWKDPVQTDEDADQCHGGTHRIANVSKAEAFLWIFNLFSMPGFSIQYIIANYGSDVSDLSFLNVKTRTSSAGSCDKFVHVWTSSLVGCKVTGLDGNYRITCHTVMEVLREHRDSVMAVLEAFVYDPLLNWRLMDSKRPSASPKPETQLLLVTLVFGSCENCQNTSLFWFRLFYK